MAARRVCEVLDFFGVQGAVEDFLFSVGEPLFEDLVAAQLVGPDVGGDVAPVGVVVEVRCRRWVSPRVGVVLADAAGSSDVVWLGAVPARAACSSAVWGRSMKRPWPGITAWPDPKWPQLAVRAKSSQDMLWPVVGGWHGDGGDFRSQRAFGDAGDGCLGIEERGQFAAACRRLRQLVSRAAGVSVGPAGERDAGPLHPERAGVRLPVRRVVQHGDDVVEEVFDAQSKFVEVAMGGGGEVRATLGSVATEVKTVVPEVGGNTGGTSIYQVQTTQI